MTSDFYPYSSQVLLHNLQKGLSDFNDQYNGTQCMRKKGKLADGSGGPGPFGFHSALINGKGRQTGIWNMLTMYSNRAC